MTTIIQKEVNPESKVYTFTFNGKYFNVAKSCTKSESSIAWCLKKFYGAEWSKTFGNASANEVASMIWDEWGSDM